MKKKKNNKKKTVKRNVFEIFKIKKGKKEKIVKKKGVEEVPISKKNQKKHQDKVLRNFLIISGIIIVLVLGFYFYVQSQIYFNYDGIKFQAVQIGEDGNNLLFYETKTLFHSNDGEESLFGFRIRTKPSALKKIKFENLEEFELTKINGYSFEGGTFNCDGDGMIAMPNLQRLYSKIGAQFVYDPEAKCDEQGRYNYFNFKYGDKTEIVQVGNRCYDVIISGNDESCEILPATEKIMLEVFIKYGELFG